MNKLYFSQQHIYTQLGHTVDIKDTPHYRFLETGKEKIYKDYLRNSWEFYKPGFSEEDIDKRMQYFKDLVEDIKVNGVKKPIECFIRPNGDELVHDGNHRAVIATYLNIPLPKKEIPFKEVLKIRVNVPGSFYGSKRKGMPYQSIYSPEGKIILEGRRSDILERFNLIKEEDTRDKDIIDIGCNYGNTLMLCNNARSLTGVDVDAEILTSAVRLAVFYAKRIHYLHFDVNRELNIDAVDTAFIFSVDAHLKELAGLIYFIKNKVKNVVYFETHESREMPEVIRNLFDNIELLGVLPGNRKFYRCTK